MSLLDKIVEYSIKKEYIDTAEGERVKSSIQKISKKYEFPEEWLVKMILVEAEGFNAKRSGSCVGVVQACPGESTLDNYIKSNGGYGWWKNISPSEQINIWANHHLSYWLRLAKNRKPTSQGELMLLNILPARYVDLKNGRITRDTPQKTAQASFLYSDYDPNLKKRTGGGYWSVNSASRGMDIKAQQILSTNQDNYNLVPSIGSLFQDSASVISNGLATLNSSIKSAIVTGQNCPPPPYTQQDRIIYPGCIQKTSNPIYGNGLGSGASAPGVNLINNSQNIVQPSDYKLVYNGSLKPGLMICPVKAVRMSRGYGWQIHPVYGVPRMHHGIDLAAPTGTPVLAVADGIVRFAKLGGDGYGLSIVIDHPQFGVSTRYGHHSKNIAVTGQSVKQGEIIALVGSTGISTGPHSHFEILLNGVKSTDPLQFVNC